MISVIHAPLLEVEHKRGGATSGSSGPARLHPPGGQRAPRPASCSPSSNTAGGPPPRPCQTQPLTLARGATTAQDRSTDQLQVCQRGGGGRRHHQLDRQVGFQTTKGARAYAKPPSRLVGTPLPHADALNQPNALALPGVVAALRTISLRGLEQHGAGRVTGGAVGPEGPATSSPRRSDTPRGRRCGARSRATAPAALSCRA